MFAPSGMPGSLPDGQQHSGYPELQVQQPGHVAHLHGLLLLQDHPLALVLGSATVMSVVFLSVALVVNVSLAVVETLTELGANTEAEVVAEVVVVAEAEVGTEVVAGAETETAVDPEQALLQQVHNADFFSPGHQGCGD